MNKLFETAPEFCSLGSKRDFTFNIRYQRTFRCSIFFVPFVSSSFLLHTGPYVSAPLHHPSRSLSLWPRCLLVICVVVWSILVPAAESRGRASHLGGDGWCSKQVFSYFLLPICFVLCAICIIIFTFLSFSLSPCYSLNVIFSKFDEVQRSGNMISSSGSGECSSLCFRLLSAGMQNTLGAGWCGNSNHISVVLGWINYMYLSIFYQKATGGTSQTCLLKELLILLLMTVVFPRCLTGWLPLGRSGWPNSRSLRACCPESESAKVQISCTFVFESAAKSAETCGAGFSEPGGCRSFSWILLLLFFLTRDCDFVWGVRLHLCCSLYICCCFWWPICIRLLLTRTYELMVQWVCP